MMKKENRFNFLNYLFSTIWFLSDARLFYYIKEIVNESLEHFQNFIINPFTPLLITTGSERITSLCHLTFATQKNNTVTFPGDYVAFAFFGAYFHCIYWGFDTGWCVMVNSCVINCHITTQDIRQALLAQCRPIAVLISSAVSIVRKAFPCAIPSAKCIRRAVSISLKYVALTKSYRERFRRSQLWLHFSCGSSRALSRPHLNSAAHFPKGENWKRSRHTHLWSLNEFMYSQHDTPVFHL